MFSGSGGAEGSSEARRCSCGRAEDEPPPYASVIGDSEPVSWSYAFPGVNGYEPAGDNRAIARPLVSIPLTSYGIFKIEPPCYAAATQQQQLLPHPRIVTESGPPPKVFTESSRSQLLFLLFCSTSPRSPSRNSNSATYCCNFGRWILRRNYFCF